MLSQTGNVKMQSAATATGDGTALNLGGRSSAVLQVSGTFVATITWEASLDGTNWVAVALVDLNSTTRTRATTASAAGLYLLDDAGGLQQLRARVSAYTSGAVTVVGNASE